MKRKNFLKASILAPILALFGIGKSEAKSEAYYIDNAQDETKNILYGKMYLAGESTINIKYTLNNLPSHYYDDNGDLKLNMKKEIKCICERSLTETSFQLATNLVTRDMFRHTNLI